jgi:hypothetical protein
MEYMINNKRRGLYLKLIPLFCSALLLLSVLGIAQTAHAAPVVGFMPGRIIDDAIFAASNSMGPSQIQAFLNSKVPSCDTNGTQASEFGGGTRAQWGAAHGNPAPFVCLRDYSEGGRSAAQIIYDVAQEFQINPQVLIVLLQKEQALITDTWPLNSQYRTATGYGCPDTAPCDSQYYGLTNQLTWSGRMFRAIMNNSTTWYTPYVLGNNFIRYNPNASCGGTNVNIENRSTQALYNYTPYQPNQSALDAGYGGGDSCGAYGNRNFYLYFTDWFGSTRGPLWRTADNGTLYYVDGNRKFIIPSIALVEQYGFTPQDIRFVDQASLDSIPLASSPFTSTLGQVIKSDSDGDSDGGTIYLIDSGRRIPISSMAQLTNYGFTVSDIHYLPLNDIERLNSSQVLSNFVQAPSQTVYQIENAKKRVFFELTKLNQVNSGGTLTALSDFTLDHLQYGQPQIDGSYLVVGPDGTIKLYNGASYNVLTSMDTYDCWGFTGMRTYRLPTYDMVGGTSNGNLSCLGKGAGSTIYVMNGNQRLPLATSQNVTPSIVNDDVIDRITLGTLPSVIRNDAGELSVLESNLRRAIPSMDAFGRLGYTGNDTGALRRAAYSAFQNGPLKLAQGNLTLDQSGTVSVIVGTSSRMTIGSAAQFNHFGFMWPLLLRIDDTTLSAYPIAAPLPYYIKNSSNLFLVDSGKKYLIDPSIDTALGINRTSTPSVDAGVLSYANQANMTRFIISPNGGTVYYIEGGLRRPISSWQTFLSLGGSGNIITLSQDAINRFPLGAVI